MNAELLKKMNGLHGDDDAGSVVDGSGAEVPRIEVAGNDDDLLGMLGALPVGDDVVALGGRRGSAG